MAFLPGATRLALLGACPWLSYSAPSALTDSMPENAEHKSTADVLQSSELAARLLRRLIASPGVIDTQRLFRTYARLTELITHAHPLLQDLLARHSIDDDSAGQNLPLVMDQPWLVNLNTYLTNNSSISSTSTTNNSYFATTNQFVSQANTTALTHTELHETTSQSPPSEKFRISRTPPALRQNVPVDTKEAVLNPVPKLTERSISPLVHSKGQPLTLAKGEDRKGEPVKHALSQVPASTEPLARTTVSPPVIQRESLETEIRTTRLVLKDTEKIKIEKHSAKSDSIDTRLETKTLQPPAAKKDTATETAAPPA
ncbi:MAG TPA: hypothetical protein VN843_28785, partial [Anaerolineales bacterium]|nr:hypothetical protein [Anaerolineales bacterium]